MFSSWAGKFGFALDQNHRNISYKAKQPNLVQVGCRPRCVPLHGLQRRKAQDVRAGDHIGSASVNCVSVCVRRECEFCGSELYGCELCGLYECLLCERELYECELLKGVRACDEGRRRRGEEEKAAREAPSPKR